MLTIRWPSANMKFKANIVLFNVEFEWESNVTRRSNQVFALENNGKELIRVSNNSPDPQITYDKIVCMLIYQIFI